jgi:hypothetical protein
LKIGVAQFAEQTVQGIGRSNDPAVLGRDPLPAVLPEQILRQGTEPLERCIRGLKSALLFG